MDTEINNPKVLVPMCLSPFVKFLANILELMKLLENLVGLKGLGLNCQGHLVKIFQRLMLDDGRLDKQRSAEDYPSLLELSLVTCYPTNYQIINGLSVIPRSQPLNCQLVSCKQGNCSHHPTLSTVRLHQLRVLDQPHQLEDGFDTLEQKASCHDVGPLSFFYHSIPKSRQSDG